jgi:hypothetical protein
MSVSILDECVCCWRGERIEEGERRNLRGWALAAMPEWDATPWRSQGLKNWCASAVGGEVVGVAGG